MNDDYKKVNPVIRKAAKKILEERENFPVEYLSNVRTEIVNNAPCCDVWFMTRGCSHDLNGGCTMCNYGYGKGFAVNDEEIIKSLETDISKLPDKIEELALSPTGSFFDDREVPQKLRQKIIALFGKRHFKNFLAESRCDTLTAENLRWLKTVINADNIFIEVGIESCCEWILRNCINKNLSFEEILHAVELVHNCEMKICANIAIGFPFVNESTGIVSAVHSIETALNIGFDSVVLFPYHVRPGTMLEFLWRNNFYQPCSLYSFCEVLKSLDKNILPSVSISWYRNYYGIYSNKILASPKTCPACEEKILAALDIYKNKPCAASLELLDSINCECKKAWQKKINAQEIIIDKNFMRDVYTEIGKHYDIKASDLSIELENIFSL